ncbi:MAG: Gfo/Idh/MocA family oxidoreductase [Planctomycetota bacterium]
MAKPLNIGLIGTKFMGRTHSNAYLKVAKFFDLPRDPVMHTIAARDRAETRAFAQRWGWVNATNDWRDLTQDPAIDLVDVGTPNHVHRDQAIAALEAGKHVACEKPLADTLDAAREMVKAAEKAGKRHGAKTFVWYNYRRCPALTLAHEMVKAGRLGRIYHVRGFYLQDWAGPDVPMLWRFRGDQAGSGSLGDLGAHSIDAARFVTGDEFDVVHGAVLKTFIKERAVLEGSSGGEISGRGAKSKKTRKAKSTVDDAVVFTAEFKGGAVATFEATRLSTGDKNGNKLEIHGERGGLKFNFERMGELEWYDATLPEAQQGWSTINVSNGDANHPYADAWWPTAHAIGYEHGFINQAADMIKALGRRKPRTPLPDFRDAYQTQRVLEAVTQSAKHRTPIKLSQIK